MKKITFPILLTLLTIQLFAQKDVPNSKDHPVVSRFSGSWIRFYEFNKFNQYKLRLSTIPSAGSMGSKVHTLEGAVTRIIYQCPKTVSALELYKNYEKALLQNGFENLFSCETGACGQGFGKSYPSDNSGHINGYSQDQRYFSGRRYETDSTELYVSLYTVFTQDGPIARLDVIEISTMEEGQVTVSSAKINYDFQENGKAIIDQVYFESGKAALLPSSNPALAEVAKFLKDNPSLKIFVVGHTDNDGGFDLNMTLSQQRSEAVVKALTAQYGISADRLKAKGVGYLCPVAANTSASGKSKNRRVELVAQ